MIYLSKLAGMHLDLTEQDVLRVLVTSDKLPGVIATLTPKDVEEIAMYIGTFQKTVYKDRQNPKNLFLMFMSFNLTGWSKRKIA